MNKLLLSLIIFSMSFNTYSEGESKDFRMGLGVVYSGKRIFRGALIWDAPIMAMGPSFTFYDTVSFGQGGLSIFRRFGEFHTIAVGVSAFDDNEPNGPIFVLENRVEDYKNKRQSTFGTYLKYSFRLRQYVAFTATYNKDLKRHKGVYFDGNISTSIIPFLTVGLGGSVGDKRSNTYAYGPEGASGVGHFGSFITVMLPVLPWQGALMLNYKKTKITQDSNKNADFIRGGSSNSNVSVIASWNLF